MTDRTKLRLTAEAQSDMPSQVVLVLLDQLVALEVAVEGYQQGLTRSADRAIRAERTMMLAVRRADIAEAVIGRARAFCERVPAHPDNEHHPLADVLTILDGRADS